MTDERRKAAQDLAKRMGLKWDFRFDYDAEQARLKLAADAQQAEAWQAAYAADGGR